MARVLISGASGLIGSAVVSALERRGDKVTRLVRHLPKTENDIQWDPMREIPPELVSGYDAAIHLSGESVAGRWTEAKRRRIRESRVVSTRNLASALAKCGKPPQTFICASAIGYYGDRGQEILTDESASGTGFLPEVCREWEGATEPATLVGIRTLNTRFGIVLSKHGGALKQMLTPFRLGLGGRIGSGRQWWSWIHVADVVSAIVWSAGNASIRGPINFTSPNPVANAEFTRALAAALRRPAMLLVPAFAARLALGEFAEEGLLASARAVPKKLLETGFEFRYPELRMALLRLFS